MRVVIFAFSNDQVFESPGYVQFAFIYKSEIPGTQEWPFTAVEQPGTKSSFRIPRFVPITAGDTGTIHPDLSDFICQTWRQGFSINNNYLLTGQILSATYVDPGIVGPSGRNYCHVSFKF